MTTRNEILKVFETVHGEMTGSCYAEPIEDENGEYNEVACMKDGNICWSVTRTDLMFDILIRKMGDL